MGMHKRNVLPRLMMFPFFALLLACPALLLAQPCRLVLRDICCDRENDRAPDDKDELYLLLTVHRQGHAPQTMRIPEKNEYGSITDENGTHWVMEETEGKAGHAVTGGGKPTDALWPLHLFSLAKGQSITFTLTFMEQDGGLISESLRTSLTNSIPIPKGLLHSDDDRMGSATFDIRRTATGALQFINQSVVAPRGSGCIANQHDPRWALGFEYRIGGAEGGPENYVAWLAIQNM